MIFTRFNLAMSTTIAFGIPGVIALLTKIAPNICWAPRIGGVMVGLSILLQGYVLVNPEKFTRKLKSGLSLEQRLIHIVFVVATIGTFLNAFGDLIPSAYGVNLIVQK